MQLYYYNDNGNLETRKYTNMGNFYCIKNEFTGLPHKVFSNSFLVLHCIGKSQEEAYDLKIAYISKLIEQKQTELNNLTKLEKVLYGK